MKTLKETIEQASRTDYSGLSEAEANERNRQILKGLEKSTCSKCGTVVTQTSNGLCGYCVSRETD